METKNRRINTLRAMPSTALQGMALVPGTHQTLPPPNAPQVPGAVVAFSPWIDPMQEHEDTLGSWDEFSETCYLGYVRESVGAPQLGFDGHPLGSLLRQEVLGTLQGMPPMLLQVRERRRRASRWVRDPPPLLEVIKHVLACTQAGGKECLAAEIKTFANKAKSDSGVDIVYQVRWRRGSDARMPLHFSLPWPYNPGHPCRSIPGWCMSSRCWRSCRPQPARPLRKQPCLYTNTCRPGQPRAPTPERAPQANVGERLCSGGHHWRGNPQMGCL